MNFNMGTLVGSYANVARMLDEGGDGAGGEGHHATFDDFLDGLDAFGQRSSP